MRVISYYTKRCYDSNFKISTYLYIKNLNNLIIVQIKQALVFYEGLYDCVYNSLF